MSDSAYAKHESMQRTKRMRMALRRPPAAVCLLFVVLFGCVALSNVPAFAQRTIGS
jgi:hypothetical protein